MARLRLLSIPRTLIAVDRLPKHKAGDGIWRFPCMRIRPACRVRCIYWKLTERSSLHKSLSQQRASNGRTGARLERTIDLLIMKPLERRVRTSRADAYTTIAPIIVVSCSPLKSEFLPITSPMSRSLVNRLLGCPFALERLNLGSDQNGCTRTRSLKLGTSLEFTKAEVYSLFTRPLKAN